MIERRRCKMEKLPYKMPEAAKVLDLRLTKTYELVNSGQLRIVRVGPSIRVPAAALTEFVEKLKNPVGEHDV